MKTERLRKAFGSVFTKLLLVLIITGMIINFLIVALGHYSFRIEHIEPIERQLAIYMNYVVRDLGDPPSLERAKILARRSDFEIRYESPGLNWSTSDAIPTADRVLSEATETESYPNPADLTGIKVWRVETSLIKEIEYFVIVFDNGRLVISDTEQHMRRHRNIAFAAFAVVCLVTLTIALAYLAIRWILRPMKYLSEGVAQVGEGNLEFQVPVEGTDELGEMADAFNTMTGRIGEMLHARERLLLDVSHELRSPLTRIKLALEFLPDSDTRTAIREDVLEVEKMVAEILETARIRSKHGRLDLQQTNIADLVREVAATLGDKPPGLELNGMPESVTVNADPGQIRTVLKNVIGNALKYSDTAGGPVQITMKHREAHAMATISDNGIGIPKEELPYIFEPFYRVDKSRSKKTGGYGLGLSLCKTIIEAHNGRIEIESAPETGTAVTLILPTSPHT